MRKIVHRREFLRKGSLGIAVLTAACQRAEEQPEPAAQGKPLSFPMGVQLFTVRNELEKDLEGTIAKVAAIGYKEVEMSSLHGKPASEFGPNPQLERTKEPQRPFHVGYASFRMGEADRRRQNLGDGIYGLPHPS